MNLKSKQFLGFLALLTFSFLAYQNCGKGFSASQLDSADILGKSLNSTRLFGNGEGYGGKLDVFAAVDSLNKCGQATASQAPVLEKIEVQETGDAIKTVENCQPLNPPKPVSLSAVQSRSEDGSLFVLQDLIFQKAPWIDTGFAPRDQYVDAFCLGQQPSQTNPSIMDNYELSIFKDPSTLSLDMPWMGPPPSGTVFNRQGHLRSFGVDPQSSEIVNNQQSLLPIQETVTKDSSTGLWSHSLQTLIDSQNPDLTLIQASYSTTYVSVTTAGQNVIASSNSTVISSGNVYSSANSTQTTQINATSTTVTSTNSGSSGPVQFQQCWTNH